MAAATTGTGVGAKAASGTALAVRKKEKLTRSVGGRPKKRAADEVGPEQRRLLVAQLLMERKSYRQILAELMRLPEKQRPKGLSLGTVTRDVAALRAEWAVERGRLMDELVGEEVERLNRMEASWWERAVDKGSAQQAEATEKVLAIQRQRRALLGLTGSKAAVQVMAGAAASAGGGGVNTEGPLPAGANVKVLVTYVDDRRDL